MEKLFSLKLNEYIIDSKKAKDLDQKAFLINKIPPLVLMEEAASKIYENLVKDFDLNSHKITVIAGWGNNGGDALSLARKFFFQQAIKPDIFVFENKNETELFKIQKTILETLNFNFINIERLKELINN